jgi:hypothetical protein
MTQYLYPPTGASEFQYGGQTFRLNVDGCIAVPDSILNDALGAGWTRAHQVVNTTTGKRPTLGLVPGLHIFDTTLNKPIWRNAANTQWVDSTGATV